MFTSGWGVGGRCVKIYGTSIEVEATEKDRERGNIEPPGFFCLLWGSFVDIFVRLVLTNMEVDNHLLFL